MAASFTRITTPYDDDRLCTETSRAYQLTKLLKDWSWKLCLLRPLLLRLQLELGIYYFLYYLCRLENCRLENLQSQQSVSLGRSTTVNIAGGGDEATGLSLAIASGSTSGGRLPRRNSLGNLKIPARFSQAQVELRRDLGMVREFVSNVKRGFCLAFSGFSGDLMFSYFRIIGTSKHISFPCY